MAVTSPPSLPPPTRPDQPPQPTSDLPLPTYGVTPPDPHALTYISPSPSTSSKGPPPTHNHTYTHPRAPIALLPPSEFARMHLEHVTAHPPDSVLFPFLHGLEGDNEAQCTFFASSGAHAAPAAKDPYATAGMVQDATGRVVRPPRYRGLVWVLCDDDLEFPPADVLRPRNDARAEADDGEGEYDTDSSDVSDEEGDVDMDASHHDDAARLDAMDVDANANATPPPSSQNTEAHMHPVTPLHISTIDLDDPAIAHIHHPMTHFPFSASPLDNTTLSKDCVSLVQHGNGSMLNTTLPQQHERRPSDASSGTNSESISTSSSFTSSVFTSNAGSETTNATSLPSSPCLSTPDTGGGGRLAFVGPEPTTSTSKSVPVLTSSFLANQLIQPVLQANTYIVIPSRDDDDGGREDFLEADVDWEFKSAKVPEGISLRNFGVQVPLYTSVSDIVVYSPRGVSPATLRLAARFRRAIERKLTERVGRWERGGFEVHSGGEGKQQNATEDPHGMSSGFLKYGVYVLDADTERIERELPWMVMRKEEECGCLGGCGGAVGVQAGEGCLGFSGGPEVVAAEVEGEGRTQSTMDGQVIGEFDMEVEVETEVEVEVELEEGRRRSYQHDQHSRQNQHSRHPPNHSKSHNPHLSHHSVPSHVHHPHTDHHAPHNHPHSLADTPCSTGQSYGQGSSPNFLRLHRCRRANTIDFAQREKDEMRDLTRASELISVFEEEKDQAYPFVSGSTTATFWDPKVGQVFLGNASDVPLWAPPTKKRAPSQSSQNCQRSSSTSPQSSSTSSSPPGSSRVYQQNGSGNPESINTPGDSTAPPNIDTDTNDNPSPFDSSLNLPSRGLGFDICIECHEYAPLPSSSHLRAAEEHIRALEEEWVGLWMKTHQARAQTQHTDTPSRLEIPPRPPPHPSAIIHLPFPSSPPGNVSGLNALIPVIRFLERVVTPGGLGGWLSPGVGVGVSGGVGVNGAGVNGRRGGSRVPSTPKTPPKSPRLPSPWSPKSVSPSSPSSGASDHFMGMVNGNGNGNAQPYYFPSANGNAIGNVQTGSSPSSKDAPSPPTYASRYPHPTPTYRPRPLKVLLYSSDGYTESSVPALCLLMAVKGLSLPEAYLDMQVSKRRSFFVYQSEVGLLKRVETRLGVGNLSFRSRYTTHGYGDVPRGLPMKATPVPICDSDSCGSGSGSGSGVRLGSLSGPGAGKRLTLTIPASSSAPASVLSAMPQSNGSAVGGVGSLVRRPRASTLPTFIPDHQSWFDDARFDGSFPSRVLPFLYLGNLNHASNAYMLHALGITHVVSVGECALVPPPQTPNDSSAPHAAPSSTAHFVAGQGPGGQGSLWIEEREGRIKVLDIKGVCDDGIDTLEPQLHPICTWIEKARLSGGHVLVHCRVGVSRSATVTIAYVMQHLGLSLVEAYLVVRSRRLSVLIQPNMRLLYNLLGWEVRLARERAGGDERRLRKELGRALSWPYLAKEVHALNEKYLG